MDKGRDGVTEDLLILAGLGAAAALAWWFAGHYLVHAAVAASAILALPAAVMGDLADLAGPIDIPLLSAWLLRPSQAARDILFSVPFADLAGYSYLLEAGGRNAALFSLPLIYFAARAARRLRPDIRYRTRHSLDSVIAEQARTWPAALRPLKINPAGDDQPETRVDQSEMQAVRRAYGNFPIMGSGTARRPILRPSEADTGPLTRDGLVSYHPGFADALERAGWDFDGPASFEDAALFLLRKGHPGHEEAAFNLLTMGGWCWDGGKSLFHLTGRGEGVFETLAPPGGPARPFSGDGLSESATELAHRLKEAGWDWGRPDSSESAAVCLFRNGQDDAAIELLCLHGWSRNAADAIPLSLAHFRLTTGGEGVFETLAPPGGPVRPFSEGGLSESAPELARLLEESGWDWGRPATPESAAVCLFRHGHDDAAIKLLRLHGWSRYMEERCWHDSFIELAEAGRWDQACLAGWMAADSIERPATGSFLLPPVPDRPEPPPLGRAMRPEEWLDARCLRDQYGHCDRVSVEMHLTEQLTRRFSLDALSVHELAFAACMGEFQAGSRNLIDRLAREFAPCRQPGDCSSVLVSQPDLREEIGAVVDRHWDALASLAANHYWCETALLEIWRAGRLDQPILPPAAVLWLKCENRTLWYSVQCCGGNVVIEAAAVHAHHLAERQYASALPAPHIGLAVSALVDVYLDQSSERMKARGEDDGGLGFDGGFD